MTKDRNDKLAEILEEIGDFLEPEWEYNPYWMEISEETMVETYELIHKILDFRFPPDCDGDSQINMRLVDRNKGYFWFPFPSGPYPHRLETVEEIDSEIDMTSSAIERSTDRLMELMRYRKELMEMEKSCGNKDG